jgi:hypothetical protein
MNKQTAVEWLLNELDYETICKFDKQLVQAKEMEKQQKEETWCDAIDYSIMVLKDKTSKGSKEAFDEYYDLTYGGKND